MVVQRLMQRLAGVLLLLMLLILAGCGSFYSGSVAKESKKVISKTVEKIAAGSKYETEAYVLQSPEQGNAVMVVGGIHGNEPAGSQAAERLLSLSVVKGTIIIITKANVLGLQAGKRFVPETTDLNRAYPGNKNGNPAQQITYDIVQLMKKYKISMLIDLHEARTFHRLNSKSLGQSVVFADNDKSAMLALAAVDDINKNIKEPHKKFTFIGSPIKGSTAYYAGTALKIAAFTLETSVQQPIEERVNQHVKIAKFLLASEGVIRP